MTHVAEQPRQPPIFTSTAAPIYRLVGDEDLSSDGSDPNIIGAQQVPAGTPVRQGPHGPVILTPRPSTISVSQTPLAPQVTPRHTSASVSNTLSSIYFGIRMVFFGIFIRGNS